MCFVYIPMFEALLYSYYIVNRFYKEYANTNKVLHDELIEHQTDTLFYMCKCNYIYAD